MYLCKVDSEHGVISGTFHSMVIKMKQIAKLGVLDDMKDLTFQKSIVHY